MTIPFSALQRFEQQYRKQQAAIEGAGGVLRRATEWQNRLNGATTLSRSVEADIAKWNKILNPPHLQALKQREETMARWLQPHRSMQVFMARQDAIARTAARWSNPTMPRLVTDTLTAQRVSAQMLAFESVSGVQFADPVREPVLQAAADPEATDVDVVNPMTALLEELNENVLLLARINSTAADKSADTDLMTMLTILLLVIAVATFFVEVVK